MVKLYSFLTSYSLHIAELGDFGELSTRTFFRLGKMCFLGQFQHILGIFVEKTFYLVGTAYRSVARDKYLGT